MNLPISKELYSLIVDFLGKEKVDHMGRYTSYVAIATIGSDYDVLSSFSRYERRFFSKPEYIVSGPIQSAALLVLGNSRRLFCNSNNMSIDYESL